MKTKSLITLISLAVVILLNSCDPHTPPAIHFKTGGDYTSTDVTVAPGAGILVGITAKKREDDMKRYNISYAYDGASSTTTQETFSISGIGQQNYDKDYIFQVRNQEGLEKWSFVITDQDGNIAKLSLTITVAN
jgi:hypothetical protein